MWTELSESQLIPKTLMHGSCLTQPHNHPAVSRPPSVAEETSPLNSTYCRLTVLVVK